LTARVAIDANLLLLLIVGEANRGWIAQHKRLRAYNEDAYELLIEIIGDASRVIVTPNVMTEVSNLACQGMAEPGCSQIREILRIFACRVDERYTRSRHAVEQRHYGRLGLTDAVLLQNPDPDVTLWTDDLDLYLAAAAASMPVQNFTHLRRTRGLL
jgi:hypothetical protein